MTVQVLHAKPLSRPPRQPARLAPDGAAPDGAAPIARRPHRLDLGRPVALGWLLGPALILLYWSLGSWRGVIDPRVLPAPWAAAKAAADLIAQGRLQGDLAISALRAGEGLVFGVVFGVVLALVSGLSLLGGYVLDGVIQMKRAIPTLALIPLFILWFGLGETMKVAIISIAVFIPIYIQTHAGLRGIDIRHVELAESLGLNHAAFIRHVVLPGALPGFLLGLRFAVLGAWGALVVVEQFNATSGIGYRIELARSNAQTDIILVGLVLYALLGLGSDLIVRLVEGRVLGWRRTLAR
jgi:sulfonate transport system permease protein